MALNLDEDNSLFNFVVQDGYGVKGMVDLGLSKVSAQYIQPQKEQIDKQNARIAAETLGFFQVGNHSVPVKLLEKLKDAAHLFFGQAPEERAIYRKGLILSPLVQYGTSFVPKKEKALEWKDYVSMIYTNDAEALQRWPSAPLQSVP
ncbi:hypothetical protein LWI28_022513 [Acer negundo]|uniref:Non-haem dioxygenase N-terminal domain-containing protein n=1 Tax=Acer negundo TaxID=4023 RepID=A0AAD5IGR4_ACENE|nr:hypothetical protein LWI28_022513 [Acer negundo]KAK4838991.1 hypothetical protein QYF36_018184 [Acer negundo]